MTIKQLTGPFSVSAANSALHQMKLNSSRVAEVQHNKWFPNLQPCGANFTKLDSRGELPFH